MRADVEDHALGMDGARRVDGRAHRVDALRVDRVVGRREVDEVEAVHEDRQARLLAPLAETLENLGIVIREAPRARALHEELHRVCVHPDGVVQGFLDSPRAMSSEQHCAKAKAFEQSEASPLRGDACGRGPRAPGWLAAVPFRAARCCFASPPRPFPRRCVAVVAA